MKIWTEKPLTPQSTLIVGLESTVGCTSTCSCMPLVDLRIAPKDWRILSPALLRKLFFTMETAGIEKFGGEGGVYEGLVHPYQAYDLFQDVTTIDVTHQQKLKTLAGINLKTTTATMNMVLMGASSSLLQAQFVFLLRDDEPTPDA